MRLSGKRALITGAASGMGRATARLFANEGAAVVAVDRPGADFSGLLEGQSSVKTFEQDVTEADAGDKIAAFVARELGGLDILMNNAGVMRNARFDQMNWEDWQAVLDVNLNGYYRVTRGVVEMLKEAGRGRIINTASVMARMTDHGLSAYCASKAGVAGLTRSLALDLGRFGVTANYIEPGAILTGMTAPNFSDTEIAAVWARKSPLKRLGQPEDIARAALFLASDDADFITGHGLCVDGGLTLRT